MTLDSLVRNLWQDMSSQNFDGLKKYFHRNAIIRWNNTNEEFTVDNFIRANSEYPGNWKIDVIRLEQIGDLVITVAYVSSEDDISLYVTSFFEFEDGLIRQLDEYWGDNGAPPQWRQDLKLSTHSSLK